MLDYSLGFLAYDIFLDVDWFVVDPLSELRVVYLQHIVLGLQLGQDLLLPQLLLAPERSVLVSLGPWLRLVSMLR